MPRVEGSVAVVTGGTADTAVAEEARRSLEYLGVSSTLVPDVGVAGVLRLLSRLEEIERADLIIAVAGMEASLFSVLEASAGRFSLCPLRKYGAARSDGSLPPAVNCANGATRLRRRDGGTEFSRDRRWDRKERATANARVHPRRRSGADRRGRKCLEAHDAGGGASTTCF
jgi:hypothetical protein